MAGLRRPGGAFGQLEYPTPPLQADMALKQRALDRTTPPASVPGRYKPPDQLLAFLEALRLCRYPRPGHPRPPAPASPVSA